MSDDARRHDDSKLAPPLQPSRGVGSRAARAGLVAGILVFGGSTTAQAESNAPEAAPKQKAPQESPEAEVERLEGEVQQLEKELDAAKKCKADKTTECPNPEDVQEALKVRRERLKRAKHREKQRKYHGPRH